jgi:serine/threonine protein kinase
MQVTKPLPPPSARLPGINPGLESVIVRCLEKDPTNRYQTMQEVAAALGPVCGLDAATYFGKKRSLNSQEFRVTALLQTEPEKRQSSLVMLSSEVLEPPPAKRHIHWPAMMLLGLVGVGGFALFSGEPSAIPAQPMRPTTSLTEIQPATLPTSRPSSLPESQPTTMPEVAASITHVIAPIEKKRAGIFKNVQWGFQKNTKPKKKKPPAVPVNEPPATLDPWK